MKRKRLNRLRKLQARGQATLTGTQKINRLQNKYGSARFCQFQHVRKQFYSFVKYPLAGANTINLFGDAISGVFNKQLTNMPKQNSFGNIFFILKAIRCKYLLFNKIEAIYQLLYFVHFFHVFIRNIRGRRIIRKTIFLFRTRYRYSLISGLLSSNWSF